MCEGGKKMANLRKGRRENQRKKDSEKSRKTHSTDKYDE